MSAREESGERSDVAAGAEIGVAPEAATGERAGAASQVAAVLCTGELERFYAGLSLLVSLATGGRRCAVLVSFGALEPMLAGDLEERALDPERLPSLDPAGRERFARSLGELLATARELPSLELYACSASREAMRLNDGDIEGAGLDGVMSTPRFVARTAGAQLIFI